MKWKIIFNDNEFDCVRIFKDQSEGKSRQTTQWFSIEPSTPIALNLRKEEDDEDGSKKHTQSNHNLSNLLKPHTKPTPLPENLFFILNEWMLHEKKLKTLFMFNFFTRGNSKL